MPLIRTRRFKMTQTLLRIDNLSIAFSKQDETRTVVSDLTLQIQRGETLAPWVSRFRQERFGALHPAAAALPARELSARGYSVPRPFAAARRRTDPARYSRQ